MPRASRRFPSTPSRPPSCASCCRIPPPARRSSCMDLFKDRISPGVDPAAEVKAAFLGQILKGEASSPLISKKDAIADPRHHDGRLQRQAPGRGPARTPSWPDAATSALSGITLVYDAFDEVAGPLPRANAAAKKVMDSWAAAEWFTTKPAIPETITVKVFKVDGEINTDDFSPAGDAWSRPDIPLHALAMGKTRFPGGLETIAKFRAEGHQVAFVGDVVGTGSSRKSACNSVLWHIGNEIPAVPNKKTGGVIIGSVIAPIFFNTAEDSGALPLMMDVSQMNTGDVITINTQKGEVINEKGERHRHLLHQAQHPGRRVSGRRAHSAHRRPLPDRQGQSRPRHGRDRCLRQAGQPGRQAGAGLLPGAEDGRPRLRRRRHPARHRLRTEDDHRRFPGHHRPHDRRRAQGTRLPQVPVADVHAVFLPYRRLPEAGRREDAQEPARLHRRARRRRPAPRRRRHPLLAEPPAAPRHRRHRRRQPHPLPHWHQLPGRLRSGRLRRRHGLHAAGHAGERAGALQGQAEPRHHPARRGQRHPLLGDQAGSC